MQIVAKNLSFAYDGGQKNARRALNDINLTVNDGDFFGIIGHTGSGKSTFIQHLNGIIKTQSGTLTVGGYDLSAGVKNKPAILKNLRKEVGLVFQYPEYQLFAETVADDVAFGIKNYFPERTAEETEAGVVRAMSLTGLNYNELKNRSPFELSGGQKRRVAIAGVLACEPRLLVLDEPVAGLDPEGKKSLMKTLKGLLKGGVETIIIVSHDLDEVCENCNKIAVFSEGKVTVSGTPEEIFSDRETIFKSGLDLPVTAYLEQKLEERGIKLKSDYTADGFIGSFYEEYIKIKRS